MLLSRTPLLSRPAAAAPGSSRARLARMAPAVVLARASPKEDIERAQKVLEQTIKEAEETCAKAPKSGECAVAWDNAEEVAAAVAHKKQAAKASGSEDPLEQFCDQNPDADECRIYDD